MLVTEVSSVEVGNRSSSSCDCRQTLPVDASSAMRQGILRILEHEIDDDETPSTSTSCSLRFIATLLSRHRAAGRRCPISEVLTTIHRHVGPSRVRSRRVGGTVEMCDPGTRSLCRAKYHPCDRHADRHRHGRATTTSLRCQRRGWTASTRARRVLVPTQHSGVSVRAMSWPEPSIRGHGS